MVKQEVLAALDAARGRYISGQELAAQLSVSRTAVWKAVAALRRDGIPIKAVTNRGYTLAQSVDVLNATAVAAQLDEATVKALQIEVVDRLPGTNAALRSRADAGAREGLVLIAQAQSAGRGRGGHSFYSPPGGLYMSILLRPEIGARQAVGLTAMAAVAAARAAERLCGVPITIKWVNDLWKNGKIFYISITSLSHISKVAGRKTIRCRRRRRPDRHDADSAADRAFRQLTDGGHLCNLA